MNRELRFANELISEFAKNDEKVLGLFLRNSAVVDKDGYFAYGGALVFVDSFEVIDEVKSRIMDFFVGKPNIIKVLADYRMVLVFLGKNLLKYKIEIFTKGEIRYLVEDLVNTGSKEFEKSLVLDKTGELKSGFAKYWYSPKEKLEEVFNILLTRFLDSYYNFRNYLTRSDLFRAFNSYYQSFKWLAGIIMLSEDRIYYLFEPKFLTYRIVLKDEVKEQLLAIAPVMDFVELIRRAKEMVNLFWSAVAKIEERFFIPIDYLSINKIFQQIDEKFYPAKNFRDIAKIINYCEGENKLKSGVLYRSGELSGIADENGIVPIDFFQKFGIKTVIDLREEPEHQEHNYQIPEQIEKINYVITYVPFEKTKDFVGSYDLYKNLYYGFLEYLAEDFGNVIKIIAEKLDKGAVLVHCRGGKDRTGIVMLLILGYLGISKQCIKDDYLASFQDTKEENFEYLWWLITEHYGGFEKFLTQKAKVPKEILEKIRQKLMS